MPTSINSSGITFPNGTTQTSAASGTVSSVATGNGLSGGTITTTGTLVIACPTFNTVGSYSTANYGLGDGTVSNGSNYGGAVTRYLIAGESFNQSLSGTWKAMGVDSGNNTLVCRVS